MSVYIAAVAVALMAIGAYVVAKAFAGPKNDQIDERLKAVAREVPRPAPETGSALPVSVAAVPLVIIQRTLRLAEFRLRRRTVALLGSAAVSVVALVVAAFGLETGVTVAAGLGGTGAVILRARAMGKRRQFLALLPAFIDRLRQLLAAGNSLVTAFDLALDYSEPIVQSYLRPVARRISHGATLADSLSVQGFRLGIPQLTMLSVIAHANMLFGGSLGEILSHVANVLNDRERVQREFDAMTSEIRSSAKVLVGLPIAVAGALFVLNPAYLSFFFKDAQGHMLISGAACLVVLGAIVMRAMSRVEA